VLRDRQRRGEVPEVPETASDERVTLDERLTLSAVLARVPESLREVAVYFYLDQLSREEIASLCGGSRRTVGNRLVEFHQSARLAAGDFEKKVAL